MVVSDFYGTKGTNVPSYTKYVEINDVGTNRIKIDTNKEKKFFQDKKGANSENDVNIIQYIAKLHKIRPYKICTI